MLSFLKRPLLQGFFLTAVFYAGCAGYSFADECVISVLKQVLRGAVSHNLSAGDLVRLQIEGKDSQMVEAVFLRGARLDRRSPDTFILEKFTPAQKLEPPSVTPDAELLFFADTATGQVIYFDSRSVKLTGGAAHAGGPETFKVSPQWAEPTCSGHAAFNCINYLDERLNNLPESFSKGLHGNPDEVRDLVVKDISKRWFAFRKISHRRKWFEKLGFSLKETTRSDQILGHLEAGYPVILDVPVKEVKNRWHHGFQKTVTEYSVWALDTEADVYDALHSVVAIRQLDLGKAGKHLLVLDSGPGSVSLWPVSDLRAVFDQGSNRYQGATLVGPGRS